MNVKKIVVYVVVVIICLSVGFFTGSFNSSKEIAKLETRTHSLAEKLEYERNRAAEITTGIKNLLPGIDRIAERNAELENENKKLIESIKSITKGIKQDQETVSRLIKEMDYYINQGAKQN